jgi:nucleotide-binding universal stress UspA family protein
MYRRIIVPLDGSELAESVLPHVLELAQRFDAEIVLIRATAHLQELVRESASPQAPELGIDVAKERLAAESSGAEHDLAQAREQLQRLGADRVSTRVMEGPAAAAILEAATAEPEGTLVVMATHGRGGISRIAFGSVADRVIRELRGVPVLLFRPEAS